MNGWINISVRFLLYMDLMLLFGLPLFGLYGLRGTERISGMVLAYRSLLAGAAIVGLLLSLFKMALLAQAMSGVSQLVEFEQHVLEMTITETNAGLAWTVRMTALLIALMGALSGGRRPIFDLVLIAFMAAMALATLAWGGHGVMSEGIRGYIHLSADIIHLLAVGGWVGALAAFALLLRTNKLASAEQLILLSRTLTGFAVTGTVLVVLISLTGITNYWMIIGPTISGLATTLYGQLLLAKLGLFGLMLGLAAANRFHLSPLLKNSVHNGDHGSAIVAVRRSLFIEISAAVIILALVAWLGTLNPAM